MKKGIFQTVFISLTIFMYYFYNTFLDSIKDSEAENSLTYQILSPFRLIILAMMFGIVYSALKNLFFSKMINLKKYKKQRRDFLLFDFESTLNFLKSLKTDIEQNDKKAIKKHIKEFNGLKYRPAYLNDLIENITINLVENKPLNVYLNQTNLVIEYIEHNFELEKQKATKHKVESFFDIKRVDDYYSPFSWQYVGYLLENPNEDERISWKISSLNILKYLNSLYLSFLFNTILFLLIGLSAIVSSTISVNISFWVAYATCVYGMSLIIFTINLFFAAKKRNIDVFWLNIIFYYLLMSLIYINLIMNINYFPKMLPEIDKWYKNELIQILGSLLYIVLSTMILSYMFVSILNILISKKISVFTLIDNFVLPLIFYIATLTLNILFIKTEVQDYFLINIVILLVYWIIQYFSSNISNFK